MTCPLLHMWVCAHPTHLESIMKSLYQMKSAVEFIGLGGPQFTNEDTLTRAIEYIWLVGGVEYSNAPRMFNDKVNV